MLSFRRTRFVVYTCVAASILFAYSCSNGKNGQTASNPQDSSQLANIPDIPQAIPGSNPALAIRPPFKNVNVPFQTFEVKPQEGAQIKLTNGGVINIPKNIFVDKAGKPITEPVQIEYREFHNAADILASGIPMQDAEGKYMETAGMFEIKGSCKGEEIFVAADKNISVKMASYNEGDRFDFFELNQKNCDWKEIDGEGTIKPIPNTEKAVRLRELSKELAKLDNIFPRSAKEAKNFIFDLDVNYQQLPELKAFRGVAWEFANGNTAADPAKNAWIMETEWDNASIVKKDGAYLLSLTNGDKKYDCLVRPVLNQQDYAAAMQKFDSTKVAKYKKTKQEIADAEELARLQSSIFREFDINGFGIFNWDYWKSPGTVICEPVFSCSDKSVDLSKALFYQIAANNKAVIQHTPTAEKLGLRYDPSAGAFLVAVLPNGQIASVPRQTLASSIAPQTLEFTLQPEKITSVADIFNILQKVS